MKKRLTNSLRGSLFVIMILSAAPSAFCQFWVLSGSKADSISRVIFERYSIMPDEVPRFTHFPDKRSPSYLEQDSLKREYKRDSIHIDFKEVTPRKVRDKNVYTFLVESPESVEVGLTLDSVYLAPGSFMYFIASGFNEIAGPVTPESFKKGFKKLLNSSPLQSNGVFVILVEDSRFEDLESHIHISRIKYKEEFRSRARIVGASPSSACYPQLNDQAFAVGHVDTDGRYNCSFSIINNEDADRKPLVLTARHCISGGPPFGGLPLSTADKDAIENAEFRVAWRFDCGSTTNETWRWVSTGSSYLASNWPSDHLLVELDDDLPMSINYLGWDRVNVSNGTNIYSLHHPGEDYDLRQHYSSGVISSQGADKYVVTWALGETEKGSSGSPLLRTSDHKILGGLSHEAWIGDDKYFKLSNAWTGTGALKEYLSKVNNYTSLNALITTQITGPKVVCYNGTATYSMPYLVAGESVTWSVSGGLQILSTTANSVTVKGTNSYTTATITATFTVIKDPDNPSALLTDSRSHQVWLDGPFISVTNTTTDHTSSGYVMNMSPSAYNYLHFNPELSDVTSVSWSFPGGWSVSGTTGNDVAVWSWSGTSPFTVYATNTCGSTSAYFYPNSSGFRMAANSSTIYPNVAGDYVRVSLSDVKDWEHVTSVRIIDSGTGLISYSEEITGTNHLKQSNALEIDLKNIVKGKYILEIQYTHSRDSHHLIID